MNILNLALHRFDLKVFRLNSENTNHVESLKTTNLTSPLFLLWLKSLIVTRCTLFCKSTVVLFPGRRKVVLEGWEEMSRRPYTDRRGEGKGFCVRRKGGTYENEESFLSLYYKTVLKRTWNRYTQCNIYRKISWKFGRGTPSLEIKCLIFFFFCPCLSKQMNGFQCLVYSLSYWKNFVIS